MALISAEQVTVTLGRSDAFGGRIVHEVWGGGRGLSGIIKAEMTGRPLTSSFELEL